MRAGVDEGVDARRVGTSKKTAVSQIFTCWLARTGTRDDSVFAPTVWLVCAEES